MNLKLIIIKNIRKKNYLSSELVLEACLVSRNGCMRNFIQENCLPIPRFEPMPYTYLPIYKSKRNPLDHLVLVEYMYLNGIIALKQ